jgi:hypothetical protein
MLHSKASKFAIPPRSVCWGLGLTSPHRNRRAPTRPLLSVARTKSLAQTKTPSRSRGGASGVPRRVDVCDTTTGHGSCQGLA